MSCERRIKTFKEVEEVRIECCDKAEIESLEKSIVLAVEQKLEKLNVLIKNCNVFIYDGYVLVNDRYNICYGLEEVATAFGLNIKQVQCSLRGRNYLITDELLTSLLQFGHSYKIGKNIQNQELTEEIIAIVKENMSKRVIDLDILEMVSIIKKKGQFITFREREITEISEDGNLIDRKEGNWVSDADIIRDKLMLVSKNTQKAVNKANVQLKDGTVKLIYTRAKQMGYSVQEVKKGTQTQLVLVRYE